MKPLVTFGDAEAIMRAHLAAALAARGETATTSVRAPSTPLAGEHVQVEHEASQVTGFPIVERAQVRVTVHAPAGRRSDVKALASLAQSLATRIEHPDVAGVVPLIGRSDVVEDPTTKNLMVWLLVRVDLLANQELDES